MKKAKVFISSTIYDFRDVRSALKYWLADLGYDVQLSEDSDFNADNNINSYNACLKNIESCDYFILLIGSRVGGWYDSEKKISITQAEYRKAYELLKQEKIKLISFVRKEIYDIREDRKGLSDFLETEDSISAELKKNIKNHKSKFLNNAEFIISFIDEVSRNAEIKKAVNGEMELPRANWIYQFNSFEDIVNVLKNQLNARTNFLYKIHCENVLREISSNIAYLCYKQDNDLVPNCTYASNIRNKLPEYFGEEFKVTIKELKPLQIFALYCTTHINKLSVKNLQAALISGVFFNYIMDQNTYTPSHLHIALQKMDQEISTLKNLKDIFKTFEIVSKILQLCENENEEEIVDVNYTDSTDFIVLFSIHDSISNIFKLSSYIFACIKNPDEVYAFPDLYEGPLLKDFVPEIYFKRPTAEEVYEKFSS